MPPSVTVAPADASNGRPPLRLHDLNLMLVCNAEEVLEAVDRGRLALVKRNRCLPATASSPPSGCHSPDGENTVRTLVGSVGPTGFEPVTSRV